MRALSSTLRSGALSLVTAAIVACSGSEAPNDTAAAAIVDVPESAITRQWVGNCTVHATIAWAESLRFAETGTPPNFSEGYTTYWLWLAKIQQDELSLDGSFLTIIFELVRQRGLLDEATFGVNAPRLSSATKVVEESLRSGALSTRAARHDIATVRAVVEDALGLSPTVRGMLTHLFGADLTRTLVGNETVPADARLHRPDDLVVGSIDGGAVTLADALGTRTRSGRFTESDERRGGALAWQERGDVSEGVDLWREHLLEARQAMQAGLAIPFTWLVDDDFENEADGSFRTRQRTLGGEGEGEHVVDHATLIADYQAKLASGRVLHAGEIITNPTLLAALARPDTEVQFLRVKNSWGELHLRTDAAVGAGEFKGYTDVYWDYLFPGGHSAKRATGIVLPPAAWLRIVHAAR